MPTYDYRCQNDKCANRWEVLKKMKDMDREESCPECGFTGKRLISGGGRLSFKGTGFYATDYAKPQENPKKKYGKGSGTITKKVDKMRADDPIPKKGGGR